MEAREKALEAYPNLGEPFSEDHLEAIFIRAAERQAFIRGYGQAEIDLALTPEDIGLIFNKVRELQVKYNSTEGCYQEVADWFNGLKDE